MCLIDGIPLENALFESVSAQSLLLYHFLVAGGSLALVVAVSVTAVWWCIWTLSAYLCAQRSCKPPAAGRRFV